MQTAVLSDWGDLLGCVSRCVDCVNAINDLTTMQKKTLYVYDPRALHHILVKVRNKIIHLRLHDSS